MKVILIVALIVTLIVIFLKIFILISKHNKEEKEFIRNLNRQIEMEQEELRKSRMKKQVIGVLPNNYQNPIIPNNDEIIFKKNQDFINRKIQEKKEKENLERIGRLLEDNY